MNEKDVRYLLFQLGVPTNRVSFTGNRKNGRWMNVSCPFAPYTHAKGKDENPSFGITIKDDGHSHYKCLSCGVKGRLANIPSRLGGYRGIAYDELTRWAQVTELQTSIGRPLPSWDAEAAHVEQTEDETHTRPPRSAIQRYPRALGIRYLRERGIVWPTPLSLDLRYDDYQHRILFPCYDNYGRFAGFTGRSILPESSLSKRNPKVRDYFGLDKRELFLGLPKLAAGRRVLSEGLFDYAALVQSGFRASRAILGTSLTEQKVRILIEEGEPVYFFMDNDLAGWQALFGVFDEDMELETKNAWAWRLYKEIPVWIVPYPAPFDGTDPGSLTKRQLEKAISKAWLFTGRVPMNSMDEPDLMPL